MNWAPWQGATRCTEGPRPGARHLLAYLLELHRPPGYSLGIYNCRTVVGGSSTSTHGEGRAVDFGLPVVNGRGHAIGYTIVEALGAHGAALGVQACVFDRRVWSAASPEGRRYDGLHPHYDHVHIELTRTAGERLTLTTLRHVLGRTFVEPICYARRGTPDRSCADWATDAANRGSSTSNVQQARAAAQAGADVIAVGGPADDDLAGVPHRTAEGGDALATGIKLAKLLGG